MKSKKEKSCKKFNFLPIFYIFWPPPHMISEYAPVFSVPIPAGSAGYGAEVEDDEAISAAILAKVQ